MLNNRVAFSAVSYFDKKQLARASTASFEFP